MKAPLTRLLLLLAGLFALVPPAFAHHPFAAEFDKDKPIHVIGTVSKVDWTNPHASVTVDTKDSADHVTTWVFELGGPNALKRRGWKQESMKNGDQITVDGWQARDGSHRGNANKIVLANGKTLNAASSFFEKPSKTGSASN